MRLQQTIGRAVTINGTGLHTGLQVSVTPSDKTIAGDYVASFRANAKGESSNADFRITVTTSTLWGIVGVGIIAVALLVLLGAVARFGRR